MYIVYTVQSDNTQMFNVESSSLWKASCFILSIGLILFNINIKHSVLYLIFDLILGFPIDSIDICPVLPFQRQRAGNTPLVNLIIHNYSILNCVCMFHWNICMFSLSSLRQTGWMVCVHVTCMLSPSAIWFLDAVLLLWRSPTAVV